MTHNTSKTGIAIEQLNNIKIIRLLYDPSGYVNPDVKVR